jgi:quinol monooxygenase YgiN
MSVTVVARMKVDPTKIESLFTSSKDVFEAVSEDAKKVGAIHHQFLAGDGEVVIVDEWNDAESFHAFFGDPRIGGLMQEAGVAGPPEITIYRQMDSPDRF